MQTEKITLETLLNENNVSKIINIETILELIDLHKLKENQYISTDFTKENNVLILFDTNVFNSSYLIDKFNEFCETPEFTGLLKTITNKLKVFYCDDIEIYLDVLNIKKENFSEKTIIPMFIYVDKNEVYIEKEQYLSIFEKEHFIKFFKAILNNVESN